MTVPPGQRTEWAENEAADPFASARGVADAVLYEGYSLYPYRASAPKNQLRWQFGVLVPPDYQDTAEPSSQLTECIVEGDGDTLVRVAIRFLHLQARTVEVLDGGEPRPVDRLEGDDGEHIPWDEGVEHVVETTIRLGDLLGSERAVPFEVAGGREEQAVEREGVVVGRVVRERRPLAGLVHLSARPAGAGRRAAVLRVVTENRTPWDRPGVPRPEAMQGSLIGAHTMLAVEEGAFVSLLDPPGWAASAAERCRNVGTYPVLVGPEGRRDVMLSSPIVLYDHPGIAPESPGDLFDATEIDELLTFRTLTLTDDEKREARATDERVRELIDRVEGTSAEQLGRLHGAIRSRGVVGTSDDQAFPVGSQVRLRPGRRADAHDMFLDGRIATVEATVRDVDGTVHVAVTVDDDPAAEMHRWYGRFHYFSPDEVESLEGAP